MNYCNCIKCGKAMGYRDGDIPVCVDCNELYKKQIKSYVLAHPNSTVNDVSKELHMSPKIVEYYSRTGVVHLVSQETQDAKKRLQLLAMKGLLQEKQRSSVGVGMQGKYHYLTPDKFRELNGLSSSRSR